jgi:hypothetical protein
VRAYDFVTLRVAEPMQRSLSVLFAARCHPNRWGSHRSSRLMFQLLEKFTAFLSGLERPPRDVDELTTAQVKQWRMSQAGTAGGYNAITRVGSLLRQDARLASGPVADELAVRTQRPKSATTGARPTPGLRTSSAAPASRSGRRPWPASPTPTVISSTAC